jgi:enoyl-CoA hydratase/carnithine racemase
VLLVDYRLQEHGVAVLTLDNPPLNLNTLVTLEKLMAAFRILRATSGCEPSW